MNEQGTRITQEEMKELEKSLVQEKGEIPQLDYGQLSSISILGASDSVNFLNSSSQQMKELMTSLKEAKNNTERTLLIRAAKEMRENLKAKLEIAKFVHVIDDSKGSKKYSREERIA